MSILGRVNLAFECEIQRKVKTLSLTLVALALALALALDNEMERFPFFLKPIKQKTKAKAVIFTLQIQSQRASIARHSKFF